MALRPGGRGAVFFSQHARRDGGEAIQRIVGVVGDRPVVISSLAAIARPVIHEGHRDRALLVLRDTA